MEDIIKEFYKSEMKGEDYSFEKYKEEVNTYKELWDEIQEHIFEESFKKTRNSFYLFATVPSLITILLSRSKMYGFMNFTVSFGSLIITYCYTMQCLNTELYNYCINNKGSKMHKLINYTAKYSQINPIIETD